MPRGQPRPLRLPGSIGHLRGSCHAPHTHLPAPCPCPPACPPARQPALYEFAGTPFPRERHVSCPETALQEVGRTKNGKSALRRESHQRPFGSGSPSQSAFVGTDPDKLPRIGPPARVGSPLPRRTVLRPCG